MSIGIEEAVDADVEAEVVARKSEERVVDRPR